MNSSSDANQLVFISYAKEDLGQALKLYTELDETLRGIQKKPGLRPWIDKKDLIAGRRWKNEIEQAIQNSRYFIPLFSSHSVEERGYVVRELRNALDLLNEVPSDVTFIIPVRLEDCKVSDERIKELHMVDLFPNWTAGLGEVLRAMQIEPSQKGGHVKADEFTFELDEVYWNDFLSFVSESIPFIGSRACTFEKDGKPWMPNTREIARKMIEKHKLRYRDNTPSADLLLGDAIAQSYLMDDYYILPRIAQFLAIRKGEMYPKLLLSQYLREIEPPNFSSKEFENTAYALLADLKLPIYITTNYDLFMEEAIKRRRDIVPISEFCWWSDILKEKHGYSVFDETDGYRPSPEKPLVFHLHGHISVPASMVLTEKDYFDFVIYLNKENEKYILPSAVRRALSSSSLLFVGYGLQDINFRSIFQGALSFKGAKSMKTNIAVQIPPIGGGDDRLTMVRYLDEYTREMFELNAYWGDVQDFVTEFRQRWRRI